MIILFVVVVNVNTPEQFDKILFYMIVIFKNFNVVKKNEINESFNYYIIQLKLNKVV